MLFFGVLSVNGGTFIQRGFVLTQPRFGFYEPASQAEKIEYVGEGKVLSVARG